MPGVIRTHVGYTGGTRAAPTYSRLGDHTEAVQIDFDPKRITYEDLLKIFWKGHNPLQKPWSRQYRAAVYFHNEEQKRLAIKTRNVVASGNNKKIQTAVLPATTFYLAEAYHQKYRLQQSTNLIREFRAMYPDNQDFIDSTAAARVNGYLSGYGSLKELTKEIGKYGLSSNSAKRLLEEAGVSGALQGSR